MANPMGVSVCTWTSDRRLGCHSSTSLEELDIVIKREGKRGRVQDMDVAHVSDLSCGAASLRLARS